MTSGTKVASAWLLAAWLLGSTVDARAQAPCGPLHYGSATAGAGSAPLTVSTGGGAATLGNAGLSVDADGAPAAAPLVFLLGFTRTSVPAFGVEVLVDAAVIQPALASSIGGASVALPIPSAPSLVGVHVFAQALAVDATGPVGVTASDGMQLRVCSDSLLCSTSAYQGAPASDAFSAIASLGAGRVIAGKRTSQAGNRFLLSDDYGQSWQVVGCPGSTGAHTYFFGQNGDTVLSGTGDTGNACLMRSVDRGLTWSVAQTSAQLRALAGSANVRAVFGVIHVGGGRWLANLKCLDTATKVLVSVDDGVTWGALPAQPGATLGSWSRQMRVTSSGVVLWPAVLTDQLFVSTDAGVSWVARTVPGAALFQPLCDAGGAWFCGDASASPNATLGLHRSDDGGLTWTTVTTVNLQRQTPTYWRDVVEVGGVLFASACCHEGTSTERFMQLFRSMDGGATWCSYGNPYQGPYGGMQAIYQMCEAEPGVVLAACQPDSTIVRWPVETLR